MKLSIPAVSIFLVAYASAQTAARKDLPRFMGREVTITEPELEDEFFPRGPASICVEGPPGRQCYTAPKDFGRDPNVALVQVEKDMPALLFSAASGGVSGFGIHFALLRPSTGKNLENLFSSDTSVSNQSQHAFWNDSTISDSPIFLTADFVWGPESHYEEHRYIISSYIRKPSSIVDGLYYHLEDRYMTVRKYDPEGNENILNSEKQEILARLARVKAETERQKRTLR